MRARRAAAVAAALAAVGFALVLTGWLWPPSVYNCGTCLQGETCAGACGGPASPAGTWIFLGSLVLFPGIAVGAGAWWLSRRDSRTLDPHPAALRILGAVGVALLLVGLAVMLFDGKAAGLDETVLGFVLAWGSFVVALARAPTQLPAVRPSP